MMINEIKTIEERKADLLKLGKNRDILLMNN